MGAHSDGNRIRAQRVAEEAGVEPTEDAGRPPTDLKSTRVTGPDTLPHTAGPAPVSRTPRRRARGCARRRRMAVTRSLAARAALGICLRIGSRPAGPRLAPGWWEARFEISRRERAVRVVIGVGVKSVRPGATQVIRLSSEAFHIFPCCVRASARGFPMTELSVRCPQVTVPSFYNFQAQVDVVISHRQI